MSEEGIYDVTDCEEGLGLGGRFPFLICGIPGNLSSNFSKRIELKCFNASYNRHDGDRCFTSKVGAQCGLVPVVW